MQCPVCGDEYDAGVTTCRRCDVALALPGARPPLRTAHLGHFAGPIGERVLGLLRSKGIDYDFDRTEDGDLHVRVDVQWRDDVASTLFTGWSELLAGMDRENAYGVIAHGGSHPGWFDAPTDAWTDRDGRLQVALDPDGDPDRARAFGPAMLVLGLSLLLLGLVDAISTPIGVTFGTGFLVLGALLPR